ncbi:hypothetical protein B0J18DRAFT_494809 [Chaetomium sp. MPI-SDFR-AT-0129]|nr:hypothetical protein B0J18DRAFT_494809 [Chaetomium sp. MPI-SDFR-AT-0129]
MESSRSDQPQGRLIVAVDFGTTFTGVAYTHTGPTGTESIEVVREWPGKGSYSKVPTRLSILESSRMKWGFETTHDDEPLSLLKLLLLRGDDLPSSVRTARQFQKAQIDVANTGLSPKQIVSAYLRCLREHLSQVAVWKRDQQRPVLLVVTIPAQWPDTIALDMREILQDADMRPSMLFGDIDLMILRESDAAVLSTVADIEKQGKLKLKAGDIVTVCDIGGATTDVVTNKVTSVGPLAMVPLVPGNGGFSAVIFMRQKVTNLLQEKLRDRGANFAHVTESEFDKVAEAEWDKRILKKHTAGGTSYQVTIPHNWGLVAGTGLPVRGVKISSAEIDEILNGPVGVTRELIRRQCAAVGEKTRGGRPQYILLCGGFSGSPYLVQKVKEDFPSVSILRCEDDGKRLSAVCRGAVMAAISAEARPTIGLSGAWMATARYAVVSRQGIRKLINRGEQILPGRRIALQREDFALTEATSLDGTTIVVPELVITRLGFFDVAMGTSCSVVLRFEMGEAFLRGEVDGGELELMVVGRNDNEDPRFTLLHHGLGVSPMRAEIRNH